MNTKLIMTASATILGLGGFVLTFLPEELLTYIDISGSIMSTLVLQILGSLYFAFAMLNWMAKGNITGGIYNRPIVIANLTHFLIGGLTLIKILLKNFALPSLLVIITVIYFLFLILFSTMLFRNPKQLK